MAPFHFFKLSGPIIAGIFSRRMPDLEPKPCPFLPSKTIHCKINPIFTSYSVAKIQSDFKTLRSRKLSSSSLFPPPWMHHFAMGYAFTEVAAQTLAFFLKQVVVKREKEGEVGPEEGELKIEVHPWQALLKTWEATQARGNWGGELEAEKSLERIEKKLERIEMLVSSVKLYHSELAQKLDKIEDLLAKLNTKLEALERERTEKRRMEEKIRREDGFPGGKLLIEFWLFF